MDPEVPRESQHLFGHLDDVSGDVVVSASTGATRIGSDGTPAVYLLRPRVLLAGRITECLGHVTHGRLRPVADDVGYLGGIRAPVTLIDVLDDFFTTATFDVEIDVGGTVTFGCQESFEQQLEQDRICLGDADRETHC